MLTGTKLIEYDDTSPDLAMEAEALIDSALKVSRQSSLPRMVHMCGIPGAGKTTNASRWIAANRSFNLVQFDGIMEGLSGYKKDKSDLGLEKAFNRWELPARAIGYRLLQTLIEHKRDVLFDHSAAARQHVLLLNRIKSRGYFVEMHHIDCPPAVAARRIQEREKNKQRHTPEQLIHDRHELLKELIPIYRQLVDKFVSIPQTYESRLPLCQSSGAQVTD